MERSYNVTRSSSEVSCLQFARCELRTLLKNKYQALSAELEDVIGVEEWVSSRVSTIPTYKPLAIVYQTSIHPDDASPDLFVRNHHSSVHSCTPKDSACPGQIVLLCASPVAFHLSLLRSFSPYTPFNTISSPVGYVGWDQASSVRGPRENKEKLGSLSDLHVMRIAFV